MVMPSCECWNKSVKDCWWREVYRFKPKYCCANANTGKIYWFRTPTWGTLNILQHDQIEFGGQLRAYSSKGCFHGASILDLQKGVCHAAANDHHVHLQPLRSSSICPLEQQVLHNEEMKKKDHITCKPKELVAKMHCVSFFLEHMQQRRNQQSSSQPCQACSWSAGFCRWPVLSVVLAVMWFWFVSLTYPNQKDSEVCSLFFCKCMVQTRGSKTQHCYVSALNIPVQTTTLPFFIVILV